MGNNLNIFSKKKILIYGLGKSGLSAYKFLKNKNSVYLYDDFKQKIKRKEFISYKKILKANFDQIILSPGVDINKCRLAKFLKKNFDKVFTDLDVFYSFYKNNCITITGTNGKSTTCQLLYKVFLKQKLDVKLAGNIGYPILSVKGIKKKSIIIIEASSYQLEYSKIFKSKYAVILNLSPDHIERHKTLKNYIRSKFKLLKNQSKENFAFIKDNDSLISKEIKSNKFNSQIIKVNTKKNNSFLRNITNEYFLTETNKENLLFVLKIAEKFKLKLDLVKKTIQNFRGLDYRQQIVYKKKNLTIINDSKSTSFSSTIALLKTKQNIYWLLGGIHKKGDTFILSKKYYKNIKAFIYGNNKNFFNYSLNGKIEYKNFKDLKDALLEVFSIIKKQKKKKNIILFSPCAASFDLFKNFEDRGLYFNKLIKRYLKNV